MQYLKVGQFAIRVVEYIVMMLLLITIMIVDQAASLLVAVQTDRQENIVILMHLKLPRGIDMFFLSHMVAVEVECSICLA